MSRIGIGGRPPTRSPKPIKGLQHGTAGAYAQGCGCDECRAQRAAYMRDYRQGIRRGHDQSHRIKHPGLAQYKKGCRCEGCRALGSAARQRHRLAARSRA